MSDTVEKYRTIKKLNFLILKLNSMRSGSIEFEIPQYYEHKMIDRLEGRPSRVLNAEPAVGPRGRKAP
jgi:hypothetical protein